MAGWNVSTLSCSRTRVTLRHFVCPPRRFPGVLIQGDSLSITRNDVAGIVKACDQGDVDEARDEAAFLLSNLDELLAHYTAAPKAHGIPPRPGP